MYETLVTSQQLHGAFDGPKFSGMDPCEQLNEPLL